MPQNNTRHSFDFNILHRCTLDFGKGTYLCLCKFDIFHIAGGNFSYQRVYLTGTKTETWRCEFIKLFS